MWGKNYVKWVHKFFNVGLLILWFGSINYVIFGILSTNYVLCNVGPLFNFTNYAV